MLAIFKSLDRNTKLLIGLLFLLGLFISSISISSYIAVSNILSEKTHKTLSAILINSANSQDVATIYSDINRLMDSSLEDSETAKIIGKNIEAKLKKIDSETEDRHLKEILSEMAQSLNIFLGQLLSLNISLVELRGLHNEALESLEQIEKYVGDLLIKDTIAGEDTKYAEQLLMLIVGYEESLHEIDRLFTKENVGYYFSNDPLDISSIEGSINELLLRLNTLTASEAEIQSKAKRLLLKVKSYKGNLIKYRTSFERLVLQRQELESHLKRILYEMKVLDVNISKYAQELDGSVLKTIFYSTLFVFLLMIVAVGILGFFIFGLVRSMEIEIDKRKSAQKGLVHSETRLKALSEASFEGIFFSEEGICKDLNQAAEKLIGYSRKEAIGKPLTEWVVPIDRETIFKKITLGSESPYEITILKKDGAIFPCEFQERTVNDKDKKLRITALRDISDRKIAESEKEKVLLFAAEQKKLSLVGQVAGKMAHDFNNVLASIMGNTELALMDCEDENIIKKLDLIFKQTLRGSKLTMNLVAFAHDNEPKQIFFQLSHKIDLVLNLIKRDLEGIDVQRKDEPQLPDLLADPGMIEHLVINLLHNSIHATGKSDNPLIFIRSFELNGYICLEVEDNGCGIPSQHIESVYDPAFSLKGSKDTGRAYKEGVKGTGYGLANVKKYVTQHKGEIQIDSKKNFGTKVVVRFPVIHKALTDKEKRESRPSKNHCEKSILLLEDESTILDVQYRILTEPPLNHHVDIAQNGKVAIDMFSKNKYDLISLDYILPGDLTGMDVYKYVRSKNKTVPIIIISGNIEFLESLTEFEHEDRLMAHLSKPCQNVEYVDAINQLLELNNKIV